MKKVWRILSYILVAALSSAATLALVYTSAQVPKLEELARLIDEYYVEEADMKALEDAAAEAMVTATGDRWSYYVPAEEYAAYVESVENAYVGIGITITVAHDGSGLQVMEVNPGGSAQEAGILVDDVITAIEGQSTAGMTTTDARNLVRGEEGTPVEITVWRGGETLTFSVPRKKVEVTVAYGEMLDDKVGMITIANFDERCARETIAAIETLLEQGAEKLIFDVRGNPGGYAHEMVRVLDYLLPEGDLFRTVNYAGEEDVDTSDADCLQLPMAVLVDRESYSAAEFFAAAMGDYDAAVVIGEKTSGKGHYQNSMRLSDGSAVSLSTGKYFTPAGVCLEGVGLTPDVHIPLDEDTANALYYNRLAPEDDPHIQAALDAMK